MKKFYQSKINIKEVITLLIGLAFTFHLIPAQHVATITELVMVCSPLLGMVFRTWFTNTVVTWENEDQ